ncbi:enoyl-CoA hydratase/isomerase family protein [Aspergillus fischeri NRRL 181]|uniref:Enoyl-CoA hydratase/isomerase family protein n=1 Tax=Neosartorya fischeri (strain ATCC 1020 / DSM 3700 / CBS 544.65 / FGSC A1164 / JCM 1740 / NRRL 181 / WB 181) TaxID=331117 RepID=A1DAF7_NEOFI|nr:enoyl-CoA hydratase/isomerase family protein [Aspergillus fischeri NRRL 181]EAW19847.1 enoyl-CoA hydratase/isomerase family protein [Aspergillus fischeri NRRL 181]
MDYSTQTEGFILAETQQSSTRILTLNRPNKRNALCQALINELLHQLKIVSADPHIRAIVIAGSGAIFSAGADIKEIAQLDGETARQKRYLEDLCHAMKQVRKPIIAAVEGKALGGGFELALMADFIVATPEVEFRLPEISIGLIPGAGGTQRVTAAVGKYRAMNMILLNEPLSGNEAYQVGLVCKLVEPGKALSGALEIAEKLASQSASTLMVAKEAICRGETDELQHDHEFERSLYYATFGTRDMVEGVTAFLEKRAPVWRTPS